MNIPPWSSEEARRKEEHVARFMGREYRAYLEDPVSIEQLDLDPASGPLTEKTTDLMKVHYDQEFFLFSQFLDQYYMAYTMAYYGDSPDEAYANNISLEEAQFKKFQLICDRIGITGDERILNIGCGFGSFERYLLETYPEIEVVGVTPSSVQANYIMRCMEDNDHIFSNERFAFFQSTFEEFNEQRNVRQSFDVVVSIGFFEAVRNLKLFNEMVFDWLRPGGRAFHHAIVSKILLPQTIKLEETVIGKYFPGSRVWPYDELPKHSGPLVFENSWFVNGINYWKTLDAWHENYWKNMFYLKERLSQENIAYWNDYFILCKGCFCPLDGKVFGNGHYLFRKPV